MEMAYQNIHNFCNYLNINSNCRILNVEIFWRDRLEIGVNVSISNIFMRYFMIIICFIIYVIIVVIVIADYVVLSIMYI